MTLTPLVSVVLPCFNARQSLRKCVRSIQTQGVPATEILIVDDRSTDDSVRIAEDLTDEDGRIGLLRHSVNQGVASARNTGLRQARGQFVCFLDADDEYAPGFFEGVLPLLERD